MLPEGAARHPASLLPDSAYAVQGIHSKKLIYQYNIDIQISVAYAAHSACNKRKRSDDFDTSSASYPNSGGLVNYGEEEGMQVEITQHLGLIESEGNQDSGASRSTQVSSIFTILVIKFAMWTGREHDLEFLALRQ